MKKSSFFWKLLLLTLAAVFLLPQKAAATEHYRIQFGQLHNHSGYEDFLETEGCLPGDAFDAAREMDFYGLTDYGFSLREDTWASGREAAETAANQDFTALYGFETSNFNLPSQDHIAVFGTEGFLNWEAEGFDSVADVYEALEKQENAVGMFCHPDVAHGDHASFQGYSRSMALLEVMSEEGIFLDGYQAALTAGWHVAPTASAATHQGHWGEGELRTGVLLKDGETLLDGLLARRAYATNDPDLEIFFDLGGHIMGSRVISVENYTVHVRLSRPQGTVIVMTEDGEAAREPAAEDMEIPVPEGHDFYYLQIEDGGSITAVTAPVWVEALTDFGVLDFSTDAEIPTLHQEEIFSFTLHNQEIVNLQVDSFQLFAGETPIWEAEEAFSLAPGERKEFSVPYTHDTAGETVFSLVGTGYFGETQVSFEKTLTLTYLPPILKAHILVDGRHSAVTGNQIQNLTALAKEASMDVAIFREETPQDGKILIVPPPERDLEENYPQLLAQFVENGGHLILCGTKEDNHRLNALLESLGSTMVFHNDTASDPVHNGGVEDCIYPDVFQDGSQEEGSFYAQLHGCTLDAGKGSWLVRGKDTMIGEGKVLLARETIGNGTVTIAGSFFLDDEHLVLPRDPWDVPRYNQLYLESILDIQRVKLPISDIKTVRSGTLGDIFRVTGYVTAGTSKEHNRFPDLIYLQDGTGGIEITGFSMPNIQVGLSLDITGQLELDGKNPALKLITCRIIENDLYCHAPAVSPLKAAMDYEAHGGELLKVEAVAETILYTPDGLGVRRFTLRDADGSRAEVLIEDYILSGADGVNHLAKVIKEGETIRASGILHLEDNGNPVLRVRNCDEVVFVPPIPEKPEEEIETVPDLSNPKTADPYAAFFTFLQF